MSLKPFVLNNTDLQFLLKQVTFQPLFDVNGNAIIAWNGVGPIYDGYGNLIWDGVSLYSTPEAAIGQFGQSYASTTDLSGIRDVSGRNNNLLLVNNSWGTVDQPFTRTVAANFADYVKPKAAGDADASYGARTFNVDTDAGTPGIQYSTSLNSYTTTVSNTGEITQANVVDYTPRMISRTVTTGGVTPLLDANNHIVNWDPAQYNDDTVYKALIDGTGTDIATLVEGAAVVTSYGQLETLDGHRDYQKTVGTPGSSEIFIGAENPGVAPTNGWFAIFGQFFDHGLDKLGAGGQGTKIKIALATDDPLYGALGPDGQPTTSINISRATVAGVDANGDPTYINHTSPFIDQSQTYGSHAQMTQLLRQWVSSDNGATFHAGMELFDGQTLVDAWTRPDDVTTHQTLPTLNELRDHILDTTSLVTNRQALTWEDVLDLRNRDTTTGALSGGNSGQALLLDMNPRFDAAHLDATTVVGTSNVNALVDAAVATLSASLTGSGFAFSRTGLDGVSGGIQLVISDGAGAPFHVPDGIYTGASALMLWVNFANFSIYSNTPAVEEAVGQILMAAVGDHYIAGDGRVNENIALTAVHHVFHEEHNFQVQNIINTVYAQDAAAGGPTHSILHQWQINTGATDAQGNYIYANNAGTADDVIAWDQDKMFNAAKLIVEMEYQHAAIDQYARTITPHILEVVGYSSGVDPTVSLEFAQSAFRFGHSTIRETIDTIDPTHGLTGQIVSYALESAFLNPGLYSETGAAAIALGMSHQQMNEVDEFITPALNQGLLGLPLDLAAINIARGRDFGIPSLNEFRAAVGLTQYVSWDDYAHNMIHPTSLVSFIAAYAFDGDVARAQALVGLFDGSIVEGTDEAMNYTTDDAIMFMYNEAEAPAGADAFNRIDTWIGGLAEAHVPGGLLGSTFDLVFTNQMESLINGDRFYYLVRLFGQQFSEEVGNGQFKDIVERNTGLEHLNGSILAYADKYYDFSLFDSNAAADSHKTEHKYGEILAANPNLGIWSDGSANPNSTNSNGTLITVGGVQYIRDFRPDLAPDELHPVEGTPTSGADSHEVIVGTNNADFVHMRSGDDTFYGEGGGDKIFGDFGNDRLYGGAGADIIDSGDGADLVDGGDGDDVIYGFGSGTEIGGFDQLVGGSGNDIIYGGEGVDKLSGGAGDDKLYGETNTDPFTHGGDGNDYIDGGSSGDNLYGDNGDDFVYGSDDQDIVQGDAGDDILRPGKPSQAINGGPDEVIGGTGFVDDGFDIMDLSDWDIAPTGVIADLLTQANPLIAIDGTTSFPAWFQMEGVVGTQNNDTLTGTDAVTVADEVTLFGGRNWLIGGSGSDLIRGNGGNDVIIGGSIRLDSLIGRYETAGVADSYTTYDAFAGASNRIAATSELTEGLLGAAGMGDQKHFTEFLKTKLFKDHVLGDGLADGTADMVVFTGNRADYTVERIFYTTANEGVITAYVITDTVDDRDGTDIILGVESIQFADGLLTPDSLFNVKPDGTLAFTAVQNPGGVSNNANAIRLSPASSLFDANNISPSNPTGAVTTGITYSWLTAGDTPISTNTGANPYVDAAGRLVVHTTNGTIVREKATYTDAGNVLETVIKDWNLIVGTSGNNSGNNVNTGTRNGTANSDAIFGLAGSDTLNGLAGDDRLYGGSGADTLNGGAGDDYLDGGTGTNGLRGGAGNDIYLVSSGDDTVDERVYNGNAATNNSDAGGIDTVLSSITYTLTSSTATGNASRGLIENLTLTGTGNINGTGNALVNVITGNSGNNTLNGGGAADTLIGGAGNDTYDYDALDTIFEAIGGGTDLLRSAVTVSLAGFASIENLALTGNAAINGTGNGLANVITGNGAANTLNGGDGTDTLTGNGGADILNGDAGADTLNGGTGADTLTGGAGDDIFDFNVMGDSGTTAATRDIIVGFEGGGIAVGDIIDLGSIGGTFTFIGNAVFGSNGTNQLRYQAFDRDGVGGNDSTLIQLDNDNSNDVDASILLQGYIGTLVAGDFIL